jgi:hypothetical protein
MVLVFNLGGHLGSGTCTMVVRGSDLITWNLEALDSISKLIWGKNSVQVAVE